MFIKHHVPILTAQNRRKGATQMPVTKVHLFFKENLIKNKAIALEYEELKKKLALDYPNDRKKYTEGKAEFIKSVLERMNNC